MNHQNITMPHQWRPLHVGNLRFTLRLNKGAACFLLLAEKVPDIYLKFHLTKLVLLDVSKDYK